MYILWKNFITIFNVEIYYFLFHSVEKARLQMYFWIRRAPVWNIFIKLESVNISVVSAEEKNFDWIWFL